MDLKTRNKILEIGNFDCWVYSFQNKTIYFGNTLARILNMGENQISYQEFINRIPEHAREKTEQDISAMVNRRIERYIYTTTDANGREQRFQSTTTNRWIDPEEGEMISGYILEIQEDNKILNVDPRAFFSSSIESQIMNGDLDSAINLMLRTVLEQMDVDRVAVFVFNQEKGIRECPYEVSKKEFATRKHRQKVPLESQRWMIDPILQGKPFILYDTEHFSQDQEQREVFKDRGIRSIMISPFSYSYKNTIKGCISADSISKLRMWTLNDYRWFDAVATLVSVCMQMKDRQEQEMKNASEVRTLSEEIRQGVYDGIPVGVEFYNKKGNIIDFNNQDMEIFGFHSKESLLGISAFDNPNLPEETREAMKRGDDVDLCLSYSFKKVTDFYDSSFDNDTKDIVMKGKAIYDKDGEFLYYLMTNSDDTKTDKSIYQYKDFKELFSLIASYSKMGYAKYSYPSGKGFFLSQWFKSYEISSNNPYQLASNHSINIHPDDEADFAAFFKKAILTDEELTMSKDFRVLCKDGSTKWIHTYIIIAPGKDSNGDRDVTELNFDITKSKIYSEKLMESKRQAEAANRLKAAFLSNMSHEIRTPLNAIVGFSNILANSEDPVEKAKCLEVIESNNARLLKLVSNILDLSKIDAGTMEFRYGDFDIIALVNKVTNDMSPKAQEKKLTMTLKQVAQECVVHSDQHKINIVLEELLNNAIKFTDTGSITVGCRRDEKNIIVNIIDTGAGISSELISQIFNRFTKFDERSDGTGLGLSMCKAIIEKLDGKIGVVSSPGKGSEFWFSLKI